MAGVLGFTAPISRLKYHLHRCRGTSRGWLLLVALRVAPKQRGNAILGCLCTAVAHPAGNPAGGGQETSLAHRVRLSFPHPASHLITRFDWFQRTSCKPYWWEWARLRAPHTDIAERKSKHRSPDPRLQECKTWRPHGALNSTQGCTEINMDRWAHTYSIRHLPHTLSRNLRLGSPFSKYSDHLAPVLQEKICFASNYLRLDALEP